jgi:tripartite-type tricarboxylate transporter receptor subunit TctC
VRAVLVTARLRHLPHSLHVRSVIGVLALGALTVLPSYVVAASPPYPDRPLRVIVPFPPGGSTDTVVRVVGQKLTESLGQQVVVDNRPGAGTIIATEIASRAPADGYTLLIASAAFTVNPSLYAKLPYNPEKDFAPVTQLAAAPNILVVHPSIQASSMKDLIALAKAKPRQLNFGSAGAGSSNHLAGEMLKTMAGIDIVHVPYKGDAPAVTDLLSGQIQMLFIGPPPVVPHIKAGKLKAIAIASRKPSPLMPQLPTVADSGLPGFESTVWSGLLMPAGAPASAIDRVHREIARLIKLPDVQERFVSLAFDPIGSSPAEFRSYLRDEMRRWSEVVKRAGIKME